METAYIAGIIDGEGTITLSRCHKGDPYRTPIVSCSSTTCEILEYLQKHYGGSIVSHKIYQEHHKPSWSWKVQYRAALRLCADILPFLIEPSKKYRAQLLVTEYLLLTPRNGRYSTELRRQKLAFEDRFFHPSTPQYKLQEPMSLQTAYSFRIHRTALAPTLLAELSPYEHLFVMEVTLQVDRFQSNRGPKSFQFPSYDHNETIFYCIILSWTFFVSVLLLLSLLLPGQTGQPRSLSFYAARASCSTLSFAVIFQ